MIRLIEEFRFGVVTRVYLLNTRVCTRILTRLQIWGRRRHIRLETPSGVFSGVEAFIFYRLVRRIQTEFSNLFIKQPPVNAESACSFCFVAVALLQSLRNAKLLPLCYRIV